MPFLSSNVTITIVAFSLPDVVDFIPYDQDPDGEGKIWGASGWLVSNATKALGCNFVIERSFSTHKIAGLNSSLDTSIKSKLTISTTAACYKRGKWGFIAVTIFYVNSSTAVQKPALQIAQKCQPEIKVVPATDGLLGHYDENETLHGQYADLYSGIVDIGAGPSGLEEVLDKYIPYSVVYDGQKLWGLVSGMRHAYISNPLPYDAAAVQAIAAAFVICLATICCALALNFVDIKRKNPAAYSSGGIVNLFVQSFFLEATHLPVKSNKLRMIYGMWLFTVMVFASYLQSEMRSSSMLQIPTKKIDTVEDVFRTKDCRLFCPWDMFYYIKNVTWKEKIQSDNGVSSFTGIVQDQITNDILDSKTVVIYPTPTYMKYMRMTVCPNKAFKGFFYLGSQTVYEPLYVFRFRPGFNQTIIKEFNKRVRWLRESTVPWFERRGFDLRTISCLIYEDSGGKKLLTVSESFKFENIKPIMYLWLICLVVATFVFFLELLAKLCKSTFSYDIKF